MSEVKNVYMAYKFSHLFIYLLKAVGIDGHLTKFWQKQFCTVFKETPCRPYMHDLLYYNDNGLIWLFIKFRPTVKEPEQQNLYLSRLPFSYYNISNRINFALDRLTFKNIFWSQISEFV